MILSVTWYVHKERIRALNSGDVFVREESTDAAKLSSPEPPSAESATQHATTASDTDFPPNGPPREAPTAAPASDSIPRNPTNGTVYAGGGRYELYRQGDITWRVDTETGSTCILFATDAQWSKTRVYQNGCGGHARTTAATGN
jgi:hypothetical protein